LCPACPVRPMWNGDGLGASDTVSGRALGDAAGTYFLSGAPNPFGGRGWRCSKRSFGELTALRTSGKVRGARPPYSLLLGCLCCTIDLQARVASGCRNPRNSGGNEIDQSIPI
jgi:hypothetical protein